MKYYKNTNGEVYAYETEEERQEWGLPELAEMTPEEVEAHLNPPVDPEQLADKARVQRAALLRESDWTQVSDAPVDQQAWADYRQALRDVPEQPGFPENINWPVAPEIV